jgi:F0F1-type ATP synthase delta subunit
MATPTKQTIAQILREIASEAKPAHIMIELHLLAVGIFAQEDNQTKVREHSRLARKSLDQHQKKFIAKIGAAISLSSNLQRKLGEAMGKKCKADVQVKEMQERMTEMEDDFSLSQVVKDIEKHVGDKNRRG